MPADERDTGTPVPCADLCCGATDRRPRLGVGYYLASSPMFLLGVPSLSSKRRPTTALPVRHVACSASYTQNTGGITVAPPLLGADDWHHWPGVGQHVRTNRFAFSDVQLRTCARQNCNLPMCLLRTHELRRFVRVTVTVQRNGRNSKPKSCPRPSDR